MTAIGCTRTTYRAFTGRLSETNGLHFGHKGAKVKEMQKMLKAAGFDPAAPWTASSARAPRGRSGRTSAPPAGSRTAPSS